MSEIVLSDSMLVVHTNKNSSIFREAAKRVQDNYDPNGIFGVLYDDFDAQQSIYDRWKKLYQNINIMKVAPRRITVKMDDKIHMSDVLGEAKCAPIAYTCVDDIDVDTDDNQLFFVKKRGSTSAKGVFIHSYAELKSGKVDTSSSIIHKNIMNPKLIDGKRYKLRVYVLIAHGNVYVSRDAWGSSSDVDYVENDGTLSAEILKDMHIIYMRPGRKFFKFSDLDECDEIFDNICIAVKEFSAKFVEKIKEVESDEFSLLGFDFVIDDKNDAFVIEVNHRSNYHHTNEINEGVDIPAIADMITILMYGNKYDDKDVNDKWVNESTEYVSVFNSGD